MQYNKPIRYGITGALLIAPTIVIALGAIGHPALIAGSRHMTRRLEGVITAVRSENAQSKNGKRKTSD